MSRKVILGFGLSLDGYIARRNGAMDYLTIDQEGEALMADFFSKIDTTIMGRKTAAATAEMRAEMHKTGEIPEMPAMSTYVFSRRWKPGKRDGFEVVNGSLTAFVKKLKRRNGKDTYLGGGGWPTQAWFWLEWGSSTAAQSFPLPVLVSALSIPTRSQSVLNSRIRSEKSCCAFRLAKTTQ